MVLQPLLLHTLLVLLEMISRISKLLLVREAVEGRYPTMLSSIILPQLERRTLGKVEEQETESQRALYSRLSHP